MELFKKELKMPAITGTQKPQTANVISSSNNVGQVDDSLQNSVLKNAE